MEGRISIWGDALHLVRDYPLTGSGLGTFGLAYRHYQTGVVNYYVDHAHNDYLEFAADTGLVGMALLFLPIFYLCCRMIISFVTDPRRYRPAVTLGCIGSTLGMLIYSATDFNLQIPANALIFAVVLGIGYKAACVERGEEKQVGAPSGSG
jgi:O-antigen ligase